MRILLGASIWSNFQSLSELSAISPIALKRFHFANSTAGKEPQMGLDLLVSSLRARMEGR